MIRQIYICSNLYVRCSIYYNLHLFAESQIFGGSDACFKVQLALKTTYNPILLAFIKF